MYTKFTTFLILGVLIISPLTTTAATVSTPAYRSMTTQEKIAYLYGMITQLQLLLDAKIVTEDDSIGVARPGRSGSADVQVTTLSARDIESDEAELRGEIDLDGEDEALVWFEYGEDDDDLDDRTTKRRITDSQGDERTFVVTLDDLDEDTRYYFQAVAEDEQGDRDYGSVRSFTTDDDNNSSSNGSYSLTVSDTRIDAGDSVEVEWEIPSSDEGSRNWIGLYEDGDGNRQYISWKYIDNDTDGSEEFTIDDDGDYVFRLFLDNGYVRKAESRVIEVD